MLINKSQETSYQGYSRLETVSIKQKRFYIVLYFVIWTQLIQFYRNTNQLRDASIQQVLRKSNNNTNQE